MIPIEKPKSPDDGAENILAMALVPETFKRPNGTFLIDIWLLQLNCVFCIRYYKLY